MDVRRSRAVETTPIMMARALRVRRWIDLGGIILKPLLGLTRTSFPGGLLALSYFGGVAE